MGGVLLRGAITWATGLNYHGQMTKLLLGVFCSLCLVGSPVWAQTSKTADTPLNDLAVAGQRPSLEASKLDSELFYRLLVGEITARDGDPAASFALMLDIARKTNDGTLYQRAIEIALQSRSGDAALQAAKEIGRAHV